MIADKIVSLTKYLNDLKSKLADPTPNKHKHRPVQYRELLEREIKKAGATLDRLKGKP